MSDARWMRHALPHNGRFAVWAFEKPTTMLSGFFLILGTFGVFMGMLLNGISRLTERDRIILEDLHQVLNKSVDG